MDNCIESLNLMGVGDVSLLIYAEIYDLYRRYSRSASRPGKGIRDVVTITTKNSREGVSRMEIGNLLENFKTNILSSLCS